MPTAPSSKFDYSRNTITSSVSTPIPRLKVRLQLPNLSVITPGVRWPFIKASWQHAFGLSPEEYDAAIKNLEYRTGSSRSRKKILPPELSPIFEDLEKLLYM